MSPALERGYATLLPALASAATTTAPSSAAVATTASASATESPARARLVLCLVHLEAATVEVLAIQCGDRGLGVRVVRHRDECEPARASGLSIARNGDLLDRPTVRAESGA